MTNEELKAVWISDKSHQLLKQYCRDNGQKMIFVVEKLIKDNLNGKQQNKGS
tara:strand:+ start:932 stop:1087 length:156 start_codon:yes stop_codon:yes gene_type:complete